jgi:nitrite reductase (NO-forming)
VAEAEHAHEAVADTPVSDHAVDNPVEALLDLPSLPKPSIPAPITRNSPDVVRIDLEIKEVKARLADGVNYEYWTYNGTVPGPFLRVRVGDTVELTITNPADSVFPPRYRPSRG